MTHISPLRKLLAMNWLPYLVFLCYVLAWGGFCYVLFHRSVHVYSLWIDHTQVPLWMEWVIGVFWAAPLLLVGNLMFCICIRILKHTPSWWALMASVGLVGTPISIFIAQLLASYLWELNRGGQPWEYIVPSAIAFLLSVLPIVLVQRLGVNRESDSMKEWSSEPSSSSENDKGDRHI